jgi:short-subunit dehydrogenase
MAKEMEKFGVGVTCLNPGAVKRTFDLNLEWENLLSRLLILA